LPIFVFPKWAYLRGPSLDSRLLEKGMQHERSVIRGMVGFLREAFNREVVYLRRKDLYCGGGCI
jgi:hypothetical protein